MVEYKSLGRSDRNLKKIAEDADVLLELRAVNDMITEANGERASPQVWSLSYKDGVKIIAATAYDRIFVRLRGKNKSINAKLTKGSDAIGNPSDAACSRSVIKNEMEALYKETSFLFGQNTMGVKKIGKWLEAESEKGGSFTRQVAFKMIRELFPFKKETHARIYEFFQLKKLDQELDEGLGRWSNDTEQQNSLELSENEEEGPNPRMTLMAMYRGSAANEDSEEDF